MKFFNQENGQGFVEYAFVLGLVVVMIICIMIVLGIGAKNPLDVYEEAYAECMARETIGHTECHDLALRKAYPSGGTYISQPKERP